MRTGKTALDAELTSTIILLKDWNVESLAALQKLIEIMKQAKIKPTIKKSKRPTP